MIALLIAGALGAAGLVCVVLGRRRRLHTAWHCARCDAPYGEPHLATCAECGLDRTCIGAFRRGPGFERRRVRRIGVTLLVIGWCIMAGQLSLPPLRPLMSNRLLVAEFDLLGTEAAAAEITRRLETDAVTADEERDLFERGLCALRDDDPDVRKWSRFWEELIPRADFRHPALTAHVPWMLERHVDRDASWWPIMSIVIEGVWREGLLTHEQWTTYVDAMLAPDLLIPYRSPLVPGVVVPVYLAPGGRVHRPNQGPLRYGVSVGGLANARDLNDSKIDRFAVSGSRASESAGGFAGCVPLGFLRVPNEPGGTVEVEGTVALYFDQRRRHLTDMPGFWNGTLDLTTIGAPVSARFGRRFAIGEAMPPTIGSDLELFLQQFRASIQAMAPARSSTGVLSCTVMSMLPTGVFDVEFDLEIRVGDVSANDGSLLLERDRADQAITFCREVDDFSHLGSTTSYEAMFLTVSVPWDDPAPRTCDVVLRLRAASFPDADALHDDLGEEIIVSDIPVR